MFELLFKYPASIFHKGQFVFLTPWPLWLLAIAILAAAGALFWHVRRNHGMLSGAAAGRHLGARSLHGCADSVSALASGAERRDPPAPAERGGGAGGRFAQHVDLKDASGTREAAAKAVLDGGLLKRLGEKFQVRLYKFGKEPERIQKTDQLAGAAPASRIGDTLERVLAESSSLPLGAMVLLSDGADNSGGIDLADHRRDPPPAHSRFTPSASARSIPTRTSRSPMRWCRRARCRNRS